MRVKEEQDILKVRMMGGFSMTYKGKTVSFDRSSSTKFQQLFQILLLHLEEGIAKSDLIEELYGRDEVENGNSTLNNTIFRLRRQLFAMGLPDDVYLTVQKGRCCWNGHIPVETDVRCFEKLLERAGAKSGETREKLLKKACYLYRGEFLPSMNAEPWAAVAGVRYRDMYFTCMRELFECLQEKRDYQEILKISTHASEIYPFEEWQIWRIDSLMALNRFREALDVYKEAATLYFNKFGLSPSDKMLERFRIMSSQIQYLPGNILDVREGLREEDREDGAYFCTLPSFIDTYRVMARMMERSGQSVFLMLCTLKDHADIPLEEKEKLEEAAEKFRTSVRKALRKGDLYTRYSACQFLIMLPGITQENCEIVSERIDGFFREAGGGRVKISYYVTSIFDMRWLEADN